MHTGAYAYKLSMNMEKIKYEDNITSCEDKKTSIQNWIPIEDSLNR
jgi:hypothetical protein